MYKKVTIEELLPVLRAGQAPSLIELRGIVVAGACDYEVIGFDHDRDIKDPEKPTITLAATILTQQRRWHDKPCERGWIDAKIRKWLNTEFIRELPAELLDCIIPVKKITHNYMGEPFETADRIFLPSESELFGSAIWSDYEDGPRYEAFSARRFRMKKDENGNHDWYWTRSAAGGRSTRAAHVSNRGDANHLSASDALRALPCFTIA